MPSIQDIEVLVCNSLKDLEHIGVVWDDDCRKVNNLVLYGNNGILDSLSLVHLIVRLEEDILKTYSNKLSLVDESALSRTKSPFYDVPTLAQFIMEKLK